MDVPGARGRRFGAMRRARPTFLHWDARGPRSACVARRAQTWGPCRTTGSLTLRTRRFRISTNSEKAIAE